MTNLILDFHLDLTDADLPLVKKYVAGPSLLELDVDEDDEENDAGEEDEVEVEVEVDRSAVCNSCDSGMMLCSAPLPPMAMQNTSAPAAPSRALLMNSSSRPVAKSASMEKMKKKQVVKQEEEQDFDEDELQEELAGVEAETLNDSLFASGDLMELMSKSEVKAPSKTTSASFDNIVQLQSADGSWNLDDTVAKLVISAEPKLKQGFVLCFVVIAIVPLRSSLLWGIIGAQDLIKSVMSIASGNG